MRINLTSCLISSAATSTVSSWDSSLLYVHVSWPVSSSLLSPSVAFSLFHSSLKAFLFRNPSLHRLLVYSLLLKFPVNSDFVHPQPQHCLSVPLTRLCTIGDRAFPVAAAKARNSLPAELTSARSLQTFKSKLKTHLFLFHSCNFPLRRGLLLYCKVTEVRCIFTRATLY